MILQLHVIASKLHYWEKVLKVDEETRHNHSKKSIWRRKKAGHIHIFFDEGSCKIYIRAHLCGTKSTEKEEILSPFCMPYFPPHLVQLYFLQKSYFSVLIPCKRRFQDATSPHQTSISMDAALHNQALKEYGNPVKCFLQ